MKKFLAMFLGLALAAGALAGCGKSAEFDASKPITIVSREEGSGTRGAFVELFGIEKKDENGEKVDYTTTDAAVTNSTSGMLVTVAGDDYAIGYVSLGSLNDSVKAMKIDGVEPSAENIILGDYKIARPFNIAVKENVSEQAKDFISFILSTEGQTIVEEAGYISIGANGTFTSTNPSGKVVVAGSSSVTPVMEKLKEAYEKTNSNISIELQQSDSTTGMNAAIDGICDIGMASRALKDSELEKGLNAIVIANDGIAVVANHNNPLNDLTKETVEAIYIGEAGSWALAGAK